MNGRSLNRCLYCAAMLVLVLALLGGRALRPYLAGQPVLVYGMENGVVVFNWSFSRISVIGYRASCSCVTEQDLPLSIPPFGKASIPFLVPADVPSASVEIFVNAKALPLFVAVK